ncbi:MAG: cytochrome-c peroxidase [Ferruginibacter sp.]
MQKSIFLLAGCVITIVTISSFLSTQTAGIKNSAQLGKKLFSEKILSKDSTVSCASCHKPQFAFADTAAFSVGIGGRLTNRNTPSVLNMKNRPYFFGMEGPLRWKSNH